MGWTSYHATYYKKGKVDRKAECDAYWTEGLNRGHYNVLKSAMVGSTYYAAIQQLKKIVEKNEEGENIYEDIPQNEREIFAIIFLTSTDIKQYFNFSYKPMDETMDPYQYDCPKGILNLLTPTDNEYAKEWREKCYEKIAEKKNPNAFKNLPVGSVIEVIMPFDTTKYSKGEKVKLTKYREWNSNRTGWHANYCRFTTSLMKQIEQYKDSYTIIQKG